MGPMMQPRRTITAAALVALLAACSGSSGSPTAAGSSPTDARTPTPLPATPSPAPTPTPEPTPEPIGDEPPPLTLTSIAEGLNAPINLEFTPDGWLFVNERAGRVIAVELETGDTSVALDITDRVLGGGEQGLLGLAVHPQWPGENPRAFVHYTRPQRRHRGQRVPGDRRRTSASPRPERPNASCCGSTSRMPITTAASWPSGRTATSTWGSVTAAMAAIRTGTARTRRRCSARSCASTSTAAASRTGSRRTTRSPTASAARPRSSCTALRNPWRFSFDRETGLLWIADVGQNAYEEVNRVDPVADAGANLGWNLMEASHCFVAGCSDEGLALPVAEYAHDAGCSVTGGYVYRGGAIDGLRGWYLFSDYCSGLLFGLRSDASGVNIAGSSCSRPA